MSSTSSLFPDKLLAVAAFTVSWLLSSSIDHIYRCLADNISINSIKNSSIVRDCDKLSSNRSFGEILGLGFMRYLFIYLSNISFLFRLTYMCAFLCKKIICGLEYWQMVLCVQPIDKPSQCLVNAALFKFTYSKPFHQKTLLNEMICICLCNCLGPSSAALGIHARKIFFNQEKYNYQPNKHRL